MNREEEYYIRGAQYFGENYIKLKNKEQYKEEHFLNTGLWIFRKKHNIKIFTSCISKVDYLYKVIKEPLHNVEIYYYASNVCISELETYYKNSNVKFIKLSKDPLIEFKHCTVVFASNDTIIFDKKELGEEKLPNGEKCVYRDNSQAHFDLYFSRATKLI